MMASRKRQGGGDDYDDDFDGAMEGAPSSPPSMQDLGSDDEDYASGDNGKVFQHTRSGVLMKTDELFPLLMPTIRCHIADADAEIAISDFQMTLWKLRLKMQPILRRRSLEVRKLLVSRRARLGSQKAMPAASKRRGQRPRLAMVTAILLASASRASRSQTTRRAARRRRSNRQYIHCDSVNQQFILRRTGGGQQNATLSIGDDWRQRLLVSIH